MKNCSKCLINKSFDDFYTLSNSKDGHSSVCKECKKRISKENYEKNPEKKLEYQRKYQEVNAEKVSEYYKQYYEKNYDEILEYSKNYYHNNKEQASQRSKEWREKNKERLQQYREENKEHINQLSAFSRKKRRENDVSFRLREVVSNSVRKMLKKNKSSYRKDASILQYLSFTPDQLKEHLQSQFSAEMSWENYGTYWEIDHIYPQSLLPFSSLEEKNFQVCWSLSNLQPLPKKENKEKSNKI